MIYINKPDFRKNKNNIYALQITKNVELGVALEN